VGIAWTRLLRAGCSPPPAPRQQLQDSPKPPGLIYCGASQRGRPPACHGPGGGLEGGRETQPGACGGCQRLGRDVVGTSTTPSSITRPGQRLTPISSCCLRPRGGVCLSRPMPHTRWLHHTQAQLGAEAGMKLARELACGWRRGLPQAKIGRTSTLSVLLLRPPDPDPYYIDPHSPPTQTHVLQTHRFI